MAVFLSCCSAMGFTSVKLNFLSMILTVTLKLVSEILKSVLLWKKNYLYCIEVHIKLADHMLILLHRFYAVFFNHSSCFCPVATRHTNGKRRGSKGRREGSREGKKLLPEYIFASHQIDLITYLIPRQIYTAVLVKWVFPYNSDGCCL